jgi:hypothetical protein
LPEDCSGKLFAQPAIFAACSECLSANGDVAEHGGGAYSKE